MVQLEEEHPFKRAKRHPCQCDDNKTVTAMQSDIADIKDTLEEMSDMREDIAWVKENIEEIAHEVREERDNLHTMLAELLAEVQERE